MDPSARRRFLAPLALAQFICSFAGSNMNVMINDISEDLDTTVQGVQTAITLFLLVMAALMIPGGKLTDRWGRKRCFTVGLTLYGIGALLSAVSPGLGVLILGNSILEGVGTALLIPPVYILTTLLFDDITSRARAFGVDQRDGRHRRGGRAADRRPDHLGDQLAGGVRVPGASCIALIVAAEPAARGPVAGRPDPALRHARRGPVRRRAGAASCWASSRPTTTRWLTVGLVVAGALVLVGFFVHVRAPRARRARSRCCRRRCSATAPPTSGWSPRTSSGCC